MALAELLYPPALTHVVGPVWEMPLRMDAEGRAWYEGPGMRGEATLDEKGCCSSITLKAEEGCTLDQHFHPDNDETLHVISGGLHMREKGVHTNWSWRPFALQEGETHALPRNAPHDGVFVEPTEFIVAFDPPHAVSWVEDATDAAL